MIVAEICLRLCVCLIILDNYDYHIFIVFFNPLAFLCAPYVWPYAKLS